MGPLLAMVCYTNCFLTKTFDSSGIFSEKLSTTSHVTATGCHTRLGSNEYFVTGGIFNEEDPPLTLFISVRIKGRNNKNALFTLI